ncbi:hypothetical protein Pr1d_33780 [Bythopirellula goksoeyrii]|uniref:Uncharacterized protein n=1 Tax=Bythopirellula goksoeyrii TaxID=1400387 RepID=A0A5B9QE29_9BACT|nr:hypothetical protein Pr1d_33780 [Bythopirellula goksoeyrii]
MSISAQRTVAKLALEECLVLSRLDIWEWQSKNQFGLNSLEAAKAP